MMRSALCRVRPAVLLMFAIGGWAQAENADPGRTSPAATRETTATTASVAPHEAIPFKRNADGDAGLGVSAMVLVLALALSAGAFVVLRKRSAGFRRNRTAPPVDVVYSTRVNGAFLHVVAFGGKHHLLAQSGDRLVPIAASPRQHHPEEDESEHEHG
ncbi:hypothetical protein [Noviherbaspirillum galbum]|uniref:Flagellar biosynthesis protein, FliO n=1 Tax=Noviherbaspirillum galbum TaxID=2709383 RepID=A0A6B3SUJ5_9BURK|nr:hypothetical protein [Noviherbaspirillum galbum]NEX63035.1 hypothetical protein [Noviherbaspirillum galbum]